MYVYVCVYVYACVVSMYRYDDVYVIDIYIHEYMYVFRESAPAQPNLLIEVPNLF